MNAALLTNIKFIQIRLEDSRLLKYHIPNPHVRNAYLIFYYSPRRSPSICYDMCIWHDVKNRHKAIQEICIGIHKSHGSYDRIETDEFLYTSRFIFFDILVEINVVTCTQLINYST